MISRSKFVRSLAFLTVFSFVLGTLATAESEGAKKSRPISNPKYDPSAEKVELFDAMDAGQLEAKLIPQDSKKGFLFIENKTDKPLTVKMPEGIVGVQVLNQFGGAGGGGFGGGGGGFGGGGQFGGGGGGSQPVGGGAGGLGGGGLGGGGIGGGGVGGGGGFFSIPPEKVVRLPFQSVCLAHGKPEPRSKMRYRIVRPEAYTYNPELQELISLVGSNSIDSNVAQAAAWHLTNKMSWQELAAKSVNHLGGVGRTPYFTRAQLFHAQTLVKIAQKRAADRAEEEPASNSLSRTSAPR